MEASDVKLGIPTSQPIAVDTDRTGGVALGFLPVAVPHSGGIGSPPPSGELKTPTQQPRTRSTAWRTSSVAGQHRTRCSIIACPRIGKNAHTRPMRLIERYARKKGLLVLQSRAA